MGNVLSETKRQQVIALGRLGWSLRRIEQETGVRRETAGGYLKAAGIAVGRPGGWKRNARGKTGHAGDHRLQPGNLFPQLPTECVSKPAMEVTTDLGPSAVPVEESHRTSASACEVYRETIELGLSQGRNAMGIWQDLVDGYGFARRLPEREALRAQTARDAIAGSAGGHRNRAWRRGAG